MSIHLVGFEGRSKAIAAALGGIALTAAGCASPATSPEPSAAEATPADPSTSSTNVPTQVAAVRLPGPPRFVDFAPSGDTAYVSVLNPGIRDKPGWMVEIDVSSASATRRAQVGVDPEGVAISDDGTTAYVANSGDSTLSTVDAKRAVQLNAVKLPGREPRGVTLTPDGKHVWVAMWMSNSIVVADTKSNQQTRSIPAGPWPWSTAISPNGRLAYAAADQKALTVIDARRLARQGDIVLPGKPDDVVLSPDGKTIYVALYLQRRVVAVDASTSQIIGTAEIPPGPKAIALSPDGSRLYSVDIEEPSTLTVTDTNTMAPLSTTTLPGGCATDIAVSPQGGTILVPNFCDDILSIVTVTPPGADQ